MENKIIDLNNNILCSKCNCINNSNNRYCSNCGAELNIIKNIDDHSLAMAIWGISLTCSVIGILVGFIFTIIAFVKGIIRKNKATIIVSSVTLSIYVLLIIIACLSPYFDMMFK